MMADKKFRIVSHHDTWVSLDPVKGCLNNCVYCVLKHSGTSNSEPRQMANAAQCVKELLSYPFFKFGETYVSIGNETDMFHFKNIHRLLELLSELEANGITNPISLITKSPLSMDVLESVRKFNRLNILFFLSYSGLGPRYEPSVTIAELERNFVLVKSCGFPIIHYWRPLLPENSSRQAIQKMLRFISSYAAASVFTGLKLHPELTTKFSAPVFVPVEFQTIFGEWLDPDTVSILFSEAARICPNYPIYQHTSCALGVVFKTSNRIGTMYRREICERSSCPQAQRERCQMSMRIPTNSIVRQAMQALSSPKSFQVLHDKIVIDGIVSQEEFAFLVNTFRCPIEVGAVLMNNLYNGGIYKGQRQILGGFDVMK